jgi:hypothetical protein
MSEIHRLRDETKSPFARVLLESVDEDRPDPGARGRAVAALGLGAAGAVTATVTAGTANAAGALTGAAGVSPALAAPVASVAPAGIKVGFLLKSLSIVAVGGAAGVTAVHFAATSDDGKQVPITDVASSSRVKPPAPLNRVGTPAPSVVDTGVPVEGATSAEAIPPPPRPSLRSRSGATAAPSARRAAALEEQTDMLDQARGALTQGDSSRAIATLDELGRRHANGPLAEEATVLRIEALLAAGNRAAGEALAQRFLEQHPSSAYAQRVRSRLRQAAQKQ